MFAGVELAIGEQVAVEFTPPYCGGPTRVRCFVRNRNGYSPMASNSSPKNDEDYQNVGQIQSALSAMDSPVR